MATITLYVPEQEPIAIELDAYEQITIGRGPDNDLMLDHASLSGSHAIIQNLGGSFQVTDLGSTNGTFLDGEQVTAAPLVNGSRVLFGSVDSVFSDGEAPAGNAAGEADPVGATAGGFSTHHAQIAEVSNRPAGFDNLSPIKKVVKKDTVSMIAMVLGIVAILATIAMISIAATMSPA